MTNANRVLFHGSRFDIVEMAQLGNDGQTHSRQVLSHPGAVVILPFLDANHICLIRNVRVAVGETLIELPAGTREPDEAPEQTARRELHEETGYRAGELKLLTTFYPSPGVMDERMYVYTAHDLSPGEPARETGEQIENLIVRFDEALAMINNGEISDGKTMIGLLLWSQRRRCR